jgi:hypothetical protein
MPGLHSYLSSVVMVSAGTSGSNPFQGKVLSHVNSAVGHVVCVITEFWTSIYLRMCLVRVE